MFVTLRTLDELEAFWRDYRDQFPYAAQGIEFESPPQFLRGYEWVFGPTKSAVVETVFRWAKVGIQCEWYDWATNAPDDHESWFLDRDAYRHERVASGQWSEAEESEYREECKKLSRETYRGWWRLANLPGGVSDMDWLGHLVPEINDSSLPLDVVTRMLKEQTFDDWGPDGGENEVEFVGAQGVDSEIDYWRREQESGEDYYGLENEHMEPLPL